MYFLLCMYNYVFGQYFMSIYINFLGRGEGKLVFNGYGNFVGDDEKVLDMESGEYYITLNVFNALNCTFTNGENVKHYVLKILSQF